MPEGNVRLLNYSVEGPEDAFPVVLVHGVGSNLGAWDRVTDHLTPEWRVLRLDLRGHGGSAPLHETYSLERFASDVISVMDKEGVERAHLVGFSLGGLIAQCLAVNWPDRFNKVVMLSAVAGRTPEEREKVVSRLSMLKEGGIDAVTAAARERWFTEAFAQKHPEVIEARIAEMKALDLESYIEAYRVFGQSEMAQDLHKIPNRTLVMTGEFDIGSNTRMAEFMHEQIQDSELVILPGLKHSVLVEASDLIADLVSRFLRTGTTVGEA